MIRAQAIPVLKSPLRTLPDSFYGFAIDEEKGVYYTVTQDITFRVRQLSDDAVIYSVDLSAYTERQFGMIKYSKKYNKLFLGRQGGFGGVVVVLDRNDYSFIDDISVGSRANVVGVVDELDYVLIGTSVNYAVRYSISTLTIITGTNLYQPWVGNRHGLYDEKYGFFYVQGLNSLKLFKKDYYNTGATPIRDYTLEEDNMAVVQTNDHILLMAQNTIAINRINGHIEGTASNTKEVQFYIDYLSFKNTLYARTITPYEWQEWSLNKTIVGKFLN